MEYEFSHCDLILEETHEDGALFLGDLVIARDTVELRRKKITVVLDVSGQNISYFTNEVEYSKSLRFQDSMHFQISHYFDECFQFIHEHRKAKRHVLVHCAQGISRGATIVIGYLMTYCGMSYEEARSF